MAAHVPAKTEPSPIFKDTNPKSLVDQGGLIFRAFEETMGIRSSINPFDIQVGSSQSTLTLHSEMYLGKFELRIFAMDGRLLKKGNFQAHHFLEWGHGLLPGIYLLSFQKKEAHFWKKIVVR